ncbi:mechanosensitive ion channel family protein [Pedobacter mucosus]|uniref:mechanosensitive ion channel family protein n=1 Tax=Pedobacter mucosus TaxID=2895286 RepID=UPI001EE49942|nr:mechanosensitive ion channel domain-containing protein [Pedobacter mucosus]UKT65010.1 mechanosensitive ion channel [Pedobacter mucosus]
MKPFRIAAYLVSLTFFMLPLSLAARQSVPAEKSEAQMNDSLWHTIDRLHDKANSIEEMSEKGFDLAEIRSGLPQIDSDIRSIRENLKLNITVMDMVSLQTYQTLLESAHKQLGIWRNLLLGYNRKLVNMQSGVDKLREDELLKSLSTDSLFIRLYNTEQLSIEKSRAKARRLTAGNIREITVLQAQVTKNYYQTGDLQKELNVQMRTYSARIFGNEYPMLWDARPTQIDQQALKFLNASLLTQQQLILKYLKENIVYHLFLSFLIMTVFIYWIRKNRNKLIFNQKREDWLHFATEGRFSSFPVLTALILVLNLAPFFDLDPPQAYISMLQLMLFVAVSIFVFRHWRRKNKLHWVLIGIVYIFFIGLSGVLNPGKGVRMVILILNLFLAIIAFYQIRARNPETAQDKFTRMTGYLFLIINLLAVLLNITGRVTLAKMYTGAGLIGFIQITGLSIFMNAVKTSFTLHVHTLSVENNGSSLINYEKLNTSLSRFLSFIVFILWTMVFLSNINLYTPFMDLLGNLLFKERLVGSTSITIGNVLMFFLVIYLSSLAQKYVGYFFGENQGHTAAGERKGSKVVMTKLIIIILGFLLAILVSGLPVDKITVILGAFGVGIGLGLQNVVNNFVSGVILIFERPLQVGDYVEVGGYKGWVNDIGIRATRLSNSEGAEILVPNGSILSGNLVNWTLSNSQIRVELNLKIEPEEKLELAKELIIKVLKEEEEVVNSRQAEIFNQFVNGGIIEIKVWFWVKNISREQLVRSNVITKISARLVENSISLR